MLICIIKNLVYCDKVSFPVSVVVKVRCTLGFLHVEGYDDKIQYNVVVIDAALTPLVIGWRSNSLFSLSIAELLPYLTYNNFI